MGWGDYYPGCLHIRLGLRSDDPRIDQFYEEMEFVLRLGTREQWVHLGEEIEQLGIREVKEYYKSWDPKKYFP